MANDSIYGLGGGIILRILIRHLKLLVVSKLEEYGLIFCQVLEGDPFGGFKQSCIGRETHKVILEHYNNQMNNIMINLEETQSRLYSKAY